MKHITRDKVYRDVNDIMDILKDYMSYLKNSESVTPKKDILLQQRSHEVAEEVVLFFDDVMRYMDAENVKGFDAWYDWEH